MRTRTEVVQIVAKRMAIAANYQWQEHPSLHQAIRQQSFEQQAAVVVHMVEKSMMDFRWKPE